MVDLAITPMFFTKPRCLKAIPKKKIQSGGHSTGKMAGAFAGYVNAKVVATILVRWQGNINP
jgi:hypothetical protein